MDLLAWIKIPLNGVNGYKLLPIAETILHQPHSVTVKALFRVDISDRFLLRGKTLTLPVKYHDAEACKASRNGRPKVELYHDRHVGLIITDVQNSFSVLPQWHRKFEHQMIPSNLLVITSPGVAWRC